jgi:MFS family permease
VTRPEASAARASSPAGQSAGPAAREAHEPGFGPREAPFPVGYTRYALGVLFVVYVFNFVDRSILAILLESIKRDLAVSDTYLGFLSGFAFAVFYTFLGIPIARWADGGVRRSIIALALFVWSAMTAVTGLARSFLELALARVGVGVGEAGCSPPAHSLISDYFPPERRATALAIYSVGIPVGGAIGMLLGGWLDEWYGWRVAFVAVGLPGVALALVVRLTLREPPRGYWEGAAAQPGASVGDVLRFLAGLPAFWHMALAGALHALYGYGAGAFGPSFFRRVHGMQAGELGTWLFAIGLTTGALGTFLGGFLGDWIGRRDVRWYMWLPGIATLVGVPFSFVFYLWPDGRTALLISIAPAVLGGMYLGPTFAMTQALVPPHMRATASAILLFVLNLIGMGLGPQIVGTLSDLLAPRLGVDSIRYALLSVVATCASWAVVHYALAARHLRRDLEAKAQRSSAR